MMTFLQIQSFASLIDQLPVGVEESELIDSAAGGAHNLMNEGGISFQVTDSDNGGFVVGASHRSSRGGRGTPPTSIRSDSALCGYRSDNGVRYTHERPSINSGLKMEGFIHGDGCVPSQQSAVPGVRSSPSNDFTGLGVNCGMPQSPQRIYGNAQCESFRSRLSCDRNDSGSTGNHQSGWGYGHEDCHSGSFEPYQFAPNVSNSAHGGCVSVPVVSGTGSGSSQNWQSVGYGAEGVLEGQTDERVGASDGSLLSTHSGGRTHCAVSSLPHEEGSVGGSYEGGQVQVSLVAPQAGPNKASSIILGIRTPPNGREDVVVASYSCGSDWQGTGGCQLGLTHMSRSSSPRNISSLSRRQSAPASTKVKSLAPSANAHVSAMAEQERMAGRNGLHDRGSNTSSGGTKQNALMGNVGAFDMNGDGCWTDDARCNGVPIASGTGLNDMWSLEVRKWRTHMCREIEQQKRRLLLREEACRRREEEFRRREDEARRQRMTIAALEGEVMKVTEEMQEILLEREEGRFLVQREFLNRKCQYISRLQELRPHLGSHFEDVFRAVSNCRTIGQLSTWSSIFDSTSDADPKEAATRLLEGLHNGAAAPFFVPPSTSPSSSCLASAGGDSSVRCGNAKSGVRGGALESCIIRIPSLTIDSSVVGDGSAEPPGGEVGMAVFPRSFSTGDDSRILPLYAQDSWSKSRYSQLNHSGNDDALSGQDGSAGLLTQEGGLWGSEDVATERWLSARPFDPTHAQHIKEAAAGPTNYNGIAGTNAVHIGPTQELACDGLYLKPLGSRLPSRSTSICVESEAHQPEWAPCRIESRHAEEGFEGPGSEGCSWMERVACGSGAGSLSISFFNAAPRSQRGPSPIYG